jgi:hypothetical protein
MKIKKYYYNDNVIGKKMMKLVNFIYFLKPNSTQKQKIFYIINGLKSALVVNCFEDGD